MKLAWGAEEVEISWIAESNLISRGAVEKGGAKRIKTQALRRDMPGGSDD